MKVRHYYCKVKNQKKNVNIVIIKSSLRLKQQLTQKL